MIAIIKSSIVDEKGNQIAIYGDGKVDVTPNGKRTIMTSIDMICKVLMEVTKDAKDIDGGH